MKILKQKHLKRCVIKLMKEKKDEGGKQITHTTTIFANGMITLTGAIMNFMFDNPVAGWILLGLTAVAFTIGIILYKKEKQK